MAVESITAIAACIAAIAATFGVILQWKVRPRVSPEEKHRMLVQKLHRQQHLMEEWYKRRPLWFARLKFAIVRWLRLPWSSSGH